MSEFRDKMLCSLNNHPEWQTCSDMYDRHYVNADRSGPKIPKILHQVWLGSPFPDKYKRLRDTWLSKHPDWEYKLWTLDHVVSFGMKNISSFNRSSNMGAKSDIFRYEILNRHGGLYIDTDFECVKSFNDLLYLDFFTGVARWDQPGFLNGLIACTPGHPIMIDAVNRLCNVTPRFHEIMDVTGPLFFTPVVSKYMSEHPEGKVVVFPTSFFYAFPGDNRAAVRNDTEESRIEVRKHITSDSYCLHLWYTSWQ
jgi:mannosyltransferase OCH1-like enzyme